jgi:uncharacterized repeat protein (TIGR03803 family)
MLSVSHICLAGGLAAAAWFVTGQAAQASSFQTLYTFQGIPDGAYPTAGLIYVNGTFYGTTARGGATSRPNRYEDAGTVFSLVGNTEKVIYAFGSPHDGSGPNGSLTELGGLLYGTTQYGGNHKFGTVFEVSPAGSERVLHRFHPGADGDSPVSGLLYKDGKFFGTTPGYDTGVGTVFFMTPSGHERVLLPFTAVNYQGTYYPFGAAPTAGLTEIKGRLYGTAPAGGTSTNCPETFGCGTVFELLSNGDYRVVYDFKGGSDGGAPLSALVGIDGTIYGTTSGGGTGPCACGTVFKITPDGTKTTLYSFAGGRDGYLPASLIAVGHVLYGTTEQGGGTSSICERGCGTVFKITEQGEETILHAFNGPDGKFPAPGAALLYESGELYGTTYSGADGENGTVFRVAP